MSGRLPLAVLVGGAPGSGKTTLAEALSDALDIPALHKDELVHGIWRTQGTAANLGQAGVEPFYRSMELWLELGISFVAEQTFYRGVSEPDVRERLAPRAMLVHVHCRSAEATERWERRMRQDPLCGEHRLRELRPIINQLDAELQDALDFSCPTFVVSTDDGYDPALSTLVSEIDKLSGRPLVHELDKTIGNAARASQAEP